MKTPKAEEKEGAQRGGDRGMLEGEEGEAKSSGTETFSHTNGDLSHSSTYKRKLSRITMINEC